MKIKNGFNGLLAITSVILFSTSTLLAATHASALFGINSENYFTGDLSFQSPADIKRPSNGNNTSDIISKGNVAASPEPVTLLLLGAGLMGIALYRKLKNK